MDKKALLEQFKAEVEASGTSLTHILKMCEFDEVSNDFRSDTIYDYSIGCLNGAWWMFQRQQAKVEELQKRMETLIQKYKDEDRELKLIDEWEQSQIYGLVVSELEQALKGEG